MKIADILRKKGRRVVTTTESATVLDAARSLVEHNIGSLMVTDEGRPLGIVTERDILRLTARSPERLASTRVGQVMTRDLITAGPDAAISDMMDVMTENRVRHLPVVEDGKLAGIISIGDVVNACRVEAEEENSHLRQYIHGAT